MLRMFNKYNQTVVFKNTLNFKNYSIKSKFFFFNKTGKIISYNSFFKKLHFRSLLLYISALYVTLNLNSDYNIFCFKKLPLLYFFNNKSSFYFKKKNIK